MKCVKCDENIWLRDEYYEIDELNILCTKCFKQLQKKGVFKNGI